MIADFVITRYWQNWQKTVEKNKWHEWRTIVEENSNKKVPRNVKVKHCTRYVREQQVGRNKFLKESPGKGTSYVLHIVFQKNPLISILEDVRLSPYRYCDTDKNTISSFFEIERKRESVNFNAELTFLSSLKEEGHNFDLKIMSIC